MRPVERICLCRQTCLPQASLMRSSKTANENFCETARRKRLKPHISIWKFNLSVPFPAPIQHPGRPPTGIIVDSTPRAPQRGHRPDTEGFSGPSRRSGPTVRSSRSLAVDSWQSAQELPLDVGAESMS